MKDGQLESNEKGTTRREALALGAGVTAAGLSLGLAAAAFAQEKSADDAKNKDEIDRIYKLWDDALGKKDLEAALALYADDASIESPLVQHLLKTKQGVIRGKDNLRNFIALVFKTSPPARKRYLTGFFTDGRVVTWEYPRLSPEGDQMDLVEVMEIDQGLIQRHRVYWGWHALNILAGI